MKKRLIALLLAVLMTAALLPVTALAADHDLTVKLAGGEDAAENEDYEWRGKVLHIKKDGLAVYGTIGTETIVVEEGVSTLTLGGIRVTFGVNDARTALTYGTTPLTLMLTGVGSMVIPDGCGVSGQADLTIGGSGRWDVSAINDGNGTGCVIAVEGNVTLKDECSLSAYTEKGDAIAATGSIRIEDQAKLAVTAFGEGMLTASEIAVDTAPGGRLLLHGETIGAVIREDPETVILGSESLNALPGGEMTERAAISEAGVYQVGGKTAQTVWAFTGRKLQYVKPENGDLRFRIGERTVSSAAEGETVTVETFDVTENYAVKSASYSYTNGEETVTQDISAAMSFAMPAADVAVAVTFAQVAAEIDGTGYASLANAVANVPDKGTITLLADSSETVTVYRTGTFRIYANGHENDVTVKAGEGYAVQKSTQGSVTTYTVTKTLDSHFASLVKNAFDLARNIHIRNTQILEQSAAVRLVRNVLDLVGSFLRSFTR